MTAPVTAIPSPPRLLTPDADGYLRIERDSVYAQILLNLSQDRAQPTRAHDLVNRLYPRAYPTVMNALAYLVRCGYAEKLERGRYIARVGQVPGADA